MAASFDSTSDALNEYRRPGRRRRDMPLTASEVANWKFIHDPAFSAPVPQMPAEERKAWSELDSKEGMSQVNGPKLTRDERALLDALNLKLRYRAAREKTDYQRPCGWEW